MERSSSATPERGRYGSQEALAILGSPNLCSDFTFSGGKMENKVGDNVPKQQKLEAILAQLTGAISDLKEFCITLPTEERTQLLHPRRGGEAMVERAHDLCTRYEIKVKNVPTDGMLNDLRLARQIRPFVALIQSGLTLVTDTASQAQSEYWHAFLSLYGALVKAAEHDPMLAAEVKELEDFMAVHGKRRKEPAASPSGGEPPAK
jgi:hypothetical protein